MRGRERRREKEGERLLSRQKNFCRERGELWRERKERGKRERMWERGKTERESEGGEERMSGESSTLSPARARARERGE